VHESLFFFPLAVLVVRKNAAWECRRIDFLQREKESGERKGLGCWLLILFFSLVSLFINFTTEVGGLGALRWLLEREIFTKRERGWRGGAGC